MLGLVLALGPRARADSGAPPIADAPCPPALTVARLAVALHGEVTLVGLTAGPRLELLYALGPRLGVSHARLAVGVLDGPEQLFVPVSAGYRAIWRRRHRAQPAFGAGVELQHRFVDDYRTVRQYGGYLEGGVDVRVHPHLSMSFALALDVMVQGGPGAGLAPRLGLRWDP